MPAPPRAGSRCEARSSVRTSHGISVSDSVSSTTRALQTEYWSPSVRSHGASLIAGLFVLIVGVASFAQDTRPEPATAKQVHVGWNGAYFVGRWTPVVIDVDVATESQYRLHVTAPDPDGHQVTFSSYSAGKLAPGRHQLRGFCKLGQFDFARSRTRPIDPDIEVRVDADSSPDPVLRWKSIAAGPTQLPPPLTPGTRLVVTVGELPGFTSVTMATEKPTSAEAQEATADAVHVVSASVEQLPVEALAYDGVSLLVLAGPVKLSTEQSIALRDWIARGGRVVLSLPAKPETVQEVLEPLTNWLPVTVTNEPIVVREFSSLEAYAGRNVRVPFAGRLSVPKVGSKHGAILAGSRDDALLVRAPYGFGSVTVLALDLTQPPLSQWTGVTALGRRLLGDVTTLEDLGDVRKAKRAQLSSTGVTDLATQLHGIQDSFDGVTRVSPWFVMGMLGLLLVVIGPLDYLLVHRLLRRPRATWITFPLWIAIAAVLASHGATLWNGTTLRANQFHLVNVDASTGTYRSRLWTNLYSPVTASLSCFHASLIIPAVSIEEANTSQSHISWSGIPESAFGGMYREPGIELGRGRYSRTNDLLYELPLVQWSSKSLLTEGTGSRKNLIESDLTSSGSGRLTGTLTHRFNGDLEDWFLVYGNRVYRHSKTRDDAKTLPLASGRVWRVEQPNVFQRELRPFLTGQITVATRKDNSVYQDVSHRQAVYDPLSLHVHNLARMLTFHDEAGGTKYTGLTNRLLEEEDLSHLLKLGRVILFGRLNSSTSDLSIQRMARSGPLDTNDLSRLEDVKPNCETTFVRLVFSVTKVGDEPRQLESLDPDKQPK